MVHGASEMAMTTLPSSGQSVAAARRWVAGALVGASPATSDLAQILTSELVSNAVLYGKGDELRLRLVVDDDVLIEIWDGNRAAPHIQPRETASTSGRGLQIVEALSNQWGYRGVRNDGKWVWFRIDWP
jgi:anti-sigma regulatory factor (Ser/Thr protein kinase)